MSKRKNHRAHVLVAVPFSILFGPPMTHEHSNTPCLVFFVTRFVYLVVFRSFCPRASKRRLQLFSIGLFFFSFFGEEDDEEAAPVVVPLSASRAASRRRITSAKSSFDRRRALSFSRLRRFS